MLTHAHVPSRVRPFAVPLAAARQAPLSMGLSRQEHWSGLPRPPPGDLPAQGLNLPLFQLPHRQAGSSLQVPPGKPRSLAEAFRNKPAWGKALLYHAEKLGPVLSNFSSG